MLPQTLIAGLLTLAAVLSPPTAHAIDTATQQKIDVFLDFMESNCPTTMGAAMAGKLRQEIGLDDSAAEAFGDTMCVCMNTELRALSPEELAAEISQPKASPPVEAALERCAVRGIRPHFGAMCRAYAREANAAADKTETACECFQRDADAMSELQLAELLNGQDGAFRQAFERCNTFE